MFKSVRISCFVLMSLCALVVQAAPSIRDYGALPTTQMVAISPSGKLIAYRKVTDKQDVVSVISLTEKKALINLDVSAIQPRYLQFFTDEQLMLKVSEYRRVDGFRGKFDLSTAFVLDTNTKKIRQMLIPGVKVHAGQSGLGRVIGMTPDGKHALMPAYSSVDFDYEKPKYALFKVDLNRNNLFSVDSGSTIADEYFVDANGDPLVKIEYDERTKRHTVNTKVKNDWKTIFAEEITIRDKGFVGVTADFKSLAFLADDEKTGRTAYYTMSLADGKITGPQYGRDDADIEGVVTDLQQVAYGIQYSGFTPSYLFFDAAIDKRVKDIQAKFPEHSVWLSSWSPDWKHIVVNVEGSAYAEDYYLFSDGSEPKFLTTARPQISQNDISPIGKVNFTTRDGYKIPTLITIPSDKVSAMKNLPAVIYPHGGPASYDRIGFDYFAQALASQGYLVIQPQFRGSTGFGLAHHHAGLGEWGKKMQDDLSDAVNFFSTKGYIDPKRVCIVGASYGGYAALAGGAFTPDLYKCVVSINGVSNLNDFLYRDKARNGSDSEFAAYMERTLAKGSVNKADLEARSPESNAANFNAPVLLIHSVNDKRVAIEQSQQMETALKRKKKEVELVELKGDNHHLMESPTRQEAVEATVKFVNKYLKPTVQ